MKILRARTRIVWRIQWTFRGKRSKSTWKTTASTESPAAQEQFSVAGTKSRTDRAMRCVSRCDSGLKMAEPRRSSAWWIPYMGHSKAIWRGLLSSLQPRSYRLTRRRRWRWSLEWDSPGFTSKWTGSTFRTCWATRLKSSLPSSREESSTTTSKAIRSKLYREKSASIPLNWFKVANF